MRRASALRGALGHEPRDAGERFCSATEPVQVRDRRQRSRNVFSILFVGSVPSHV